MSNTPPPEVAAAAAVVQRWLDAGSQPTRVNDEPFKKMDAKARLDYARQFPQPLDVTPVAALASPTSK
jgi:hypothetical protein